MNDLSLRLPSVPTLRQLVAGRLRDAIETGQFPQGMRLIERDLCERLGVSRTSVREALRDLEGSGLITTQANRGPIVSIITLEMAKSIYEVRVVLEGLAARLFAANATAAQMMALQDAVERLALVHQNFSAAKFLRVKSEFYQVLLAGAGNPVAADMLRVIHTRVSQLRATSLSDPARASASMAEIRAFVEALAARDEETASRLCVQHIQNAAGAALRMMRERA